MAGKSAKAKKSARRTSPRRTKARTKVRGGRRGRAARGAKRWSQRVTRESNALDLQSGVFTSRARAQSPFRLSARRWRANAARPTSYRSALSMLTFYVNRAGRTLSAEGRRTLERAKHELRAVFGKGTNPTER